MKKQTLFLGICLAVSAFAGAAVKRVGFNTTLGSIPSVDYTTISAAVTAAAPGDTIYLYPTVAENITLDKKLVFIGPGYFNASSSGSYITNAGQQLLDETGEIQITLDPGSDSSVFMGINRLRLSPATGHTSKAILVDRCKEFFANISFTDGWTIARCFDVGIGSGSSNDTVTNISIQNCYVKAFKLETTTIGSGLIDHCIFEYSGRAGYINSTYYSFYASLDLWNANFLIKNTAFLSGYNYATNNPNSVFQYCYFYYGQGLFAGGSGNNVDNYNFNSNGFYVGNPTASPSSEDGRFQLATGSAGIGAGENGSDIGIFGGSTPYKLGGIPPVPTFYQLSSPSSTTSTNPYTINFSVKGNN